MYYEDTNTCFYLIYSSNSISNFDFFHTSNDTLFAYNTSENRLEPHFVMTFPDPKNTPIHIFAKYRTEYPKGKNRKTYRLWQMPRQQQKEAGGVGSFSK